MASCRLDWGSQWSMNDPWPEFGHLWYSGKAKLDYWRGGQKLAHPWIKGTHTHTNHLACHLQCWGDSDPTRNWQVLYVKSHYLGERVKDSPGKGSPVSVHAYHIFSPQFQKCKANSVINQKPQRAHKHKTVSHEELAECAILDVVL